jgi:hypothetical protein
MAKRDHATTRITIIFKTQNWKQIYIEENMMKGIE